MYVGYFRKTFNFKHNFFKKFWVRPNENALFQNKKKNKNKLYSNSPIFK